ncbi:MAG: Lrp/AsnC family transcriptional regulator [Burkholderiales bacterium]
MAITYELDDTDWALLREFQVDARMTLAEASRKIGLTSPAVGERLRRLEESGVIRGYYADIDLNKVGRTITAFIRVRFTGGKYDLFERLLDRSPEVLECHHITGEDCFILKAAVASMSDLERLASSLSQFGSTATSIVYSTVLGRRVIDK